MNLSVRHSERQRVTRKVVIIGSGPAGWTAAIYAARADLYPLVFEGAITEDNQTKGTLPLGQLNLTTEVENFPGWPRVASDALAAVMESALAPSPGRFENLQHLYAHGGQRTAFGPELMELMRQQAINFGTEIITDDIVDVDFSRHPFTLKSLSGETYDALSVIVATGARANYLGLESENRLKNRGVSACAVCDGALPMFRGKPLVVVGGGDSAMEEATYLTKFASRVFLVHRRDAFRASKIMQDRVLANPKIEVKWNRAVDEVLGSDRVTGVKLKSTVDSARETLEASGMFCAIGHTPNTDFLKGQLELNSKGFIKWINPFRTWTSVEGVFAAGDVADDYYKQAVTAAGTGCMAALDAERWLVSKGFE
jgi:thioredoxin reductase (NADPH)